MLDGGLRNVSIGYESHDMTDAKRGSPTTGAGAALIGLTLEYGTTPRTHRIPPAARNPGTAVGS
jgi:hypothetical protein